MEMKTNLIIKLMLITLLLITLMQENTFAQTIQTAIEYYRQAKFEEARGILREIVKQGNKSDVEKAYVYLAMIEAAYNNITGSKNYLSKLLSLDPSFDLSTIKDSTQKVENLFNELKRDKTSEMQESRIKKLESRIKTQESQIGELERQREELLKKIKPPVEKGRLKELEDEIERQNRQIKSLREMIRSLQELIKEIQQNQQKEPLSGLSNNEYEQTLSDNIARYHEQFNRLLNEEEKGANVSDDIVQLLEKMIPDAKTLKSYYEKLTPRDAAIQEHIDFLDHYIFIRGKALDSRKED
jgi:predicted  nucleic acid-binding Zn-ribbon protein